MKKNFVLLSLLVFVFLVTNISPSFGASLPIIPGQNVNLYGMSTPAGSGRGGTGTPTVCKVTNLNNSGSGSLRNCLENVSSPKVVIFEVSGNITLQSAIEIGGFTGNDCATKGNYTTIAGQTAPSPGITIKGSGSAAPLLKIERNCHDIFIQHIRFRFGDDGLSGSDPKYESWDALVVDSHYRTSTPTWTPPYNLVIDHCSFSWAVDETIEFGGNDASFINNIVSEGLNSPLHPKGPHSKGFLGQTNTAGTSNLNNFFAYNLMSHSVDRNPWFKGGEVVIANNVIYDYKWGIYASDPSGAGPIKASIAGNYLKETATTANWSMYMVAGTYGNSSIYIADGSPDPANYWAGQLQTNPWNSSSRYFRSCDKWTPCSNPVPQANRASSPPLWPSGFTAMSAADARTYVLANAGARPADRDSVDTRIINQATNESCAGGCIIRSQDDVGGFPSLAENRRTFTIPSNPHEVQPSGYTKLEEWLHGYLEDVEGEVGAGGISAPSNLRIVSP